MTCAIAAPWIGRWRYRGGGGQWRWVYTYGVVGMWWSETQLEDVDERCHAHLQHQKLRIRGHGMWGCGRVRGSGRVDGGWVVGWVGGHVLQWVVCGGWWWVHMVVDCDQAMRLFRSTMTTTHRPLPLVDKGMQFCWDAFRPCTALLFKAVARQPYTALLFEAV